MTIVRAFTRSQRGKTDQFYRWDALGLMTEIDFDRAISPEERVHTTFLIKNKLNNKTIVKKVNEYTAQNQFNSMWMSFGNYWDSNAYSTPGSRLWKLSKTNAEKGLYGFTAIVRVFKPKKRHNEWLRQIHEPVISEEFLFEYINVPKIVFD